MALVRWGFESGANGNAITGANTAADNVAVTGGTGAISTTQTIEGTRSAYLVGTSTSGVVYWNKTYTNTTQFAIDTFIYIATLPSAETTILWVGSGSTRNISLALATDGKIRIRDGAGGGGASIWTSTTNLAVNAWYRVSIYATQDATSGTVRAAYYTGTATNPTEDSTLLTGRNTGASPFNVFRIGIKSTTGTVTASAYFDNYGYDTTATGLLPIASAPHAVLNVSNAVAIIDASTSTGTSLTYDITQTAGPTKTPSNVAAGKWAIPIDTTQSTSWTVTVTQNDSQTDTVNTTIADLSSQEPLVEMLYATSPGTFV